MIITIITNKISGKVVTFGDHCFLLTTCLPPVRVNNENPNREQVELKKEQKKDRRPLSRLLGSLLECRRANHERLSYWRTMPENHAKF